MDAGTVSVEESLRLALGYLPDIRLHASLVLCALAVAWIIAIRRRANRQSSPRRYRRKSMTSTSPSMPRDSRPTNEMSGSGLRIKWDRIAIALAVLLAAVVFLVTGLAALFGAGTGLVAVVSALIAVVGVVALRVLALQDGKRRRDERIEQAFAEASNPPVVTEAAVPGTAAAAGYGSSAVFDAASVATDDRIDPGEPDERVEPNEPADVETDSPSTARYEESEGERSRGDGPGQAPPPEAGETAGVPSVPRPTYLDAAEVVRPAPKPLPRPEVPAHHPDTTLKSGVSSEYLAKVQATANTSLDLDAVLKRRRAV